MANFKDGWFKEGWFKDWFGRFSQGILSIVVNNSILSIAVNKSSLSVYENKSIFNNRGVEKL